jgi:hypothetical protein
MPPESIYAVDRGPSLIFLCDQLCTHRVTHSSRSFLDHLNRTSFLVEDWAGPPAATLCALFHSVYGTKNFEKMVRDGTALPFERRADLAAVIGETAEQLVFSGAHCSSFTSGDV